MGEALFIITNVSQSTREEELQRSDIRSHVSKINWRRRKAFFRPKWELNASFPRIPTGSNIGMPWVPGELNLNVLNPGTRDMAIIEHIVAYQSLQKLPFYTRLAYTFDVRPQPSDQAHPYLFRPYSGAKALSLSSSYAGLALVIYMVETSISGRLEQSPDVLRVKNLALRQLRESLKHEVVNADKLLNDVISLLTIEMQSGDDDARLAHFGMLSWMMSEEQSSFIVQQPLGQKAATFALGMQGAKTSRTVVHKGSQIAETRTFSVPRAFENLGLPGSCLSLIERAHKGFSYAPIGSKIPKLHKHGMYEDIFQACNCLMIGEVARPTLEELVTLAIMLLCGDDTADIPATAMYIVARGRLRKALKANVIGKTDECLIWIWVVGIDSWRVRGAHLSSEGRLMLHDLWKTFPETTNSNFVQDIVARFLWTVSLLDRIRLYWAAFIPETDCKTSCEVTDDPLLLT